jgi:hypothetical protein
VRVSGFHQTPRELERSHGLCDRVRGVMRRLLFCERVRGPRWPFACWCVVKGVCPFFRASWGGRCTFGRVSNGSVGVRTSERSDTHVRSSYAGSPFAADRTDAHTSHTSHESLTRLQCGCPVDKLLRPFHCVGQLWDTRHVALLVATSCMECSRGHCVGQRWDAAWLLSYVLYGMLMSAVPIHRAPSAHAHGAQTRNSHVSQTMSSSRPLGR